MSKSISRWCRYKDTFLRIDAFVHRQRFIQKRKKSMAHLIERYSPPDWAKSMNNLPNTKVQLANAGTPIHGWNLPGIPEQFSVSIKRDDMTGSTLSGNKVRKLEFIMADVLLQNCKHVITCGGLQSNHCRAVAICARQLGLQPHLVLRTDIQDVESVGCAGNLLLDRLCGASIYLTPRNSPYLTQLKPRMEKIAAHIKETTGEECYHIPVGGSDKLGLFGYIAVFEELISQGVLDKYDDLVFACGSGGTAAGLSLANVLTGSHLSYTCGSGGTAAGLSIANVLTGSHLRIHGIAVSDDAKYFHHHVNEMIQESGLRSRSEDILNIIEGHKGQGYGISTQEELDFVVSVSLSTGIILDPVYTGKAVKGLVYELNNNPGVFKGNRILYLHTGGVFGLYDERINKTLLANGSSQTNNVKVWTNVDESPFSKDNLNIVKR